MENDGAFDLKPGANAVGLFATEGGPRSEFNITPCPKCDEPPARIVPGRVVAGIVLSAELRCVCGCAWPTLNREAFADG